MNKTEAMKAMLNGKKITHQKMKGCFYWDFNKHQVYEQSDLSLPKFNDLPDTEDYEVYEEPFEAIEMTLSITNWV